MANPKMYNNTELWNMLRKVYPNFAGITSDATADMFTQNGYEKIKNFNSTALNDFFGLTLRVWLNVVNLSHAKDPLEAAGFGEYFDQPWGGYIQRMSVDSVKPISPAYKGLKDGDSPDPFVVRKPTTAERFWKQNFDFASLITMPDEFQYKQMFVSEYGMSEYMAGIMEGLQNGYTLQAYANKLEALNAAINSTDTPLRATQKIDVAIDSDGTDEQYKKFILSVMNLVEAMTYAPQTGDFNAMGYKSTQDTTRLKLLLRMGVANAIKVKTLVGAFNPGNLALPVDVIPVANFGGLIPYKEAALTTRLYPVYDALGAMVGYAEQESATTATVGEDAVYWKDPNESVVGVVADKGLVFECRQNPYTVETIRNPRGLYTNYWAASPNNTVACDPLYNMVVINNTASN